ncbi:MBL fold metallo-hydrolase [Cohnella pontilimi]|uniref:MBL fold metallo-hydrolase n=1 Tax=Cohnella pontilimi TaxID=2564100 RepID=A0A4U0F9A4_9BACL|nr:MBL fold metallo-hydrolase [Cohnella pontilimi]TJY41277.1 MBL fold metallo-hydrolase [Cohnella pontilimi]
MLNAGVSPLLLELRTGGQPFPVHAALFRDEQNVILVDTGTPGQLEVIREALGREGVSLDQLTQIIITHQDMDHLGSLPELAEATNGRVQVLAHELCKPYIQGELPTIKRGVLVRPTKVDVTLRDGDSLPYCGGIQIIFTPGHTPDHISLYHPASRTLISGDALTSQAGTLMPPSRDFTPDMPTALRSVAKLSRLDIETVITYHGGVCTGGIRERLLQIASGIE